MKAKKVYVSEINICDTRALRDFLCLDVEFVLGASFDELDNIAWYQENDDCILHLNGKTIYELEKKVYDPIFDEFGSFYHGCYLRKKTKGKK